MGNLSRHLQCKDFFVFMQDFSINTQMNLPAQHIFPYVVIWATGRKHLQQAIGVKNDAPHNGKVYAYVPYPIV